MQMAIKPTAINPDHFKWFDYSRYSFSLGLDCGEFAYLSGHTASEFDAQTKRIVVNGDMAQQAHTAYEKIGAILGASNRTYDDVVRVVEYLRPEGIERYAEASAVREDVFGDHRPTVNTVPVKSLLRPDAFIEIEVTAARRSESASDGMHGAGVVFLPSVLPTDDHGHVIAPGDISAQTEAIFAKAETLLAALGLGFSAVVKTADYFMPQSLTAYRDTGAVRREHLGPVYPAAAGILMPRLCHDDALIQYDFVASRDTPEAINPGWPRFDKLTYSPGVRAGRLLFLSGQGAVNPVTGEAEHAGDIAAQAEYIYSNVIKVIEHAGGSAENLVKTIEYVVSRALPDYRGVGAVRSRVLNEPYPASTGLVCEALLRPELLLEVDPLAILGQSFD